MIHGPLVRKYHDGITIRSGSSWTTYRYRYNFQIDDMWSQSKIETIARITNSIIFSLKILHTHIARWYDNLFSSNPSWKCSCQFYFSYRHHTLFSIYGISYTAGIRRNPQDISPRRPGFSNSLFLSWDFWFPSHMFAQQERRTQRSRKARISTSWGALIHREHFLMCW